MQAVHVKVKIHPGVNMDGYMIEQERIAKIMAVITMQMLQHMDIGLAPLRLAVRTARGVWVATAAWTSALSTLAATTARVQL